ncbi:hypothetical protein FSP39_015186 [Pinctada imbricata]|uniref:Uncharacterized protein n=1 Tax=Pinctada imbricata TaxID=66713 RepID=A0AA88XV16_PINIB|nr:hypothetical protein FSP39_015186 [Pinctada imbricata]
MSTIQLRYHEDDQLIVSGTGDIQGSHTDLGVYPHWCLGDVTLCKQGIGVSFLFKPASRLDNSTSVVVLTSGGHTHFSNGPYFLQNYGNQYEFGVSKGAVLWRVRFSLISGSWVLIQATWNTSQGLTVVVDHEEITDKTPEQRAYQGGMYDSFTDVVIGLDDLGNPITDEDLFSLRDITFYDRPVIELNQDPSGYDGLLGCISSPDAFSTSSSISLADDLPQTCRIHCKTVNQQYAVLSHNMLCSCSHTMDESSVSDDGLCDSSFRVYRTSLVSDEGSFRLSIVVIRLQTRPYVKANETVKLSIDTDIISQMEYTLAFGDGATTITSERNLFYSWDQAGTYTISVTVTLGQFRVSNQTVFTVEDVDESVKPELVVISSHHMKTQMSGQVHFTVFDEEDTTCDIDINDGSPQRQFNSLRSYIEQKQFDHDYPTFGRYALKSTCQNRIGSTQNETYFLSKKFEIPFEYHNLEETLPIDVAGGKSFIEQLKIKRVSHSGYSEQVVQHTESGIIINSSTIHPFENLFIVEANDEVLLRRRIHAQGLFQKASVVPSVRNQARQLISNLSVQVPSGNNLFVNVSFGRDSPRLLYVYEANQTQSIDFEVDFPDLGYYPIQVMTSNDLMTNSANDLISVEVPIISISLVTHNITDKTQPVILYIDLNMGEEGPDKVSFIIDRDDGHSDFIDYRSFSHNFTTFQNSYIYSDWGIYTIRVTAKNTVSRVTAYILVQVGQNLTHVDLQTSSMSRFTTDDYAEFNITIDTGTDVTYSVEFGDGDRFIFTDIELALGTVHANSSLDNDIANHSEITTLSGNELHDDHTIEPQFESLTSTIASIVMNALTSTDSNVKSTTQTFQNREKRSIDYRPGSFATRLSEDVIKIRHLYKRPGAYRVSVNVHNAFTSRYATLCSSFLVDDTDASSCVEPDVQLLNRDTSFNDPYVNIRSREINITVNANSNCGVGNDYLHSWKAVKYFGTRERPIDEICEDESESNVFVLPALLLWYGKYRIDVTVAASGYRVRSTKKSFFLEIVPSYPYAIISGEEEVSFLVYGSVSFNLRYSRDPDLIQNEKEGIRYDLFCSQRDEFSSIVSDNLQTVIQKSRQLFNGSIAQDKQVTPLKLYEFGECFQNNGNFSSDIILGNGILSFPAESLTDSVADFTFKLFVTKNGRSNSTVQHIKIKLTNSSSADDMLNALDNIQDAAGMLRAISAIKGDILGGGTSSGNAIQKGINTMSEKFGGESMSNVADCSQNALKGISNSLPKEDTETAESARRRNKRTIIENPLPGVGVEPEMDLYDRILEEEDLYHNKFIDEFYEYVFVFPKAFRDAVRKYNTLMWLPMDVLKWPKEDVFRKYSVEWEPFDIDEYINYYCKIEKARLDQERLNADRNVAEASGGAIGSMGNLMLGKMEKARRRRKRRALIGNGTEAEAAADEDVEDVDQALQLKADNLELQLENIDPDSTETEKTMGSDKGGIKLPMSSLPKSSDGCGVGTSLTVNNDNPYTYVEQPPKASVVSLDFVDPCNPGGGNLPSANSSEPMEISITGKGNLLLFLIVRTLHSLLSDPNGMAPPAEFVLCVRRGDTITDATNWNYHSVTLDANDTTIHFLLFPERPEDRLMVYMKYEGYPNATYYDYKTTIPHEIEDFPPPLPNDPNIFENMRHAFFPPQELTALNGTYKIGVGLSKTEVDFDSSTTCLNYTTQTLITSCKILNPETEKFENRGCLTGNDLDITQVANTTTKWRTQCICYPEPPEPETTTTTMAPTTEEQPFIRNSKKSRVASKTSFGGDFVAPPNTIDFANVWAKFKNLSENAAVFSTVIVLIGLYVILLIWSRHEDKKDLLKWGATPLEDNLPSDNYHYQITVNTGSKKKAGTKSKVSFILSGEHCDTGVRRMYDGHKQEFGKGSILNFILSVENALGPLTFMRIWHDNSGKGKLKSWFLEQVMVADLQTGERFIFLCGRWLAVEEDDGMVDRILPVAGLEDLAAFKQLFNSNLRKKITSDHLWFSVFSRPTKSNFTRAQRISCCMSLLFMTMITNAMWFKGENDDKTDNSQTLKFGPVSFSMQQLFISFASTMLVFPVNFILMTFFRKCRPKKNTIMQTNQHMPKRGKWKTINGSQIFGRSAKRGLWKRFKDSVSDIINFRQRQKYANEIDPQEDDTPVPVISGVPVDEKSMKKKKKKKSSLPHWCVYIAWGLSWLSIITAGFFTILYSMQWGKEKANEWLMTFLMSFFQSVIVVQPIKVICIVAFIACILKKPEIDEEDTNEDLNNVIAAHDEEFLNKDSRTIDDIAERRKKANSEFQPPDPEELETARKQRLLEIEMEMVIREIIVYLFFIQTADQYWKWLETKFLPNLYATNYANGTEIRRWWEKRCISDMESRRIGIPRLRQLRIKPDTCVVNKRLQTLIFHCRDEYGWSDDDTKPYLPGWVKPPPENLTAMVEDEDPSPWVYQNSLKLRNAPYMATITSYKGGGYAVMFERDYLRNKKMLEGLKNQIWLDEHARGVFLEFTVYNPNINLFGSVIMVTEFMSSGGAVARQEVKVFRLLSYVGGLGILVLIFEVIYALFTLYFFIRCVRKVKKEKCKYFKSFWDILEFVLLVFAVAVIAMYVFKQLLTSVALKALQDIEKADYVNFQSLALYDEMFGWMCAIVVFLATIQFLKLLQFNKKMAMLGDTVKLASKDLKVFTISFLLYFFTFTMTGYLLFSTTMLDYSNFVGSSEAMFAFSLGSFDFTAMKDAQPVLGPIFFFLFIGVIYIGMMSIFLTIIADAFTTVKEELASSRNEYEIVDYMIRRLKGIIGFAK